MIDAFLNYLFPVSCVICSAPILERRYAAACPPCWQSLAWITPPFCPRCGTPAIAIEGPCGRCRTGETIFDFARSAVFFNDTARELVHHLKYAERVSLAQPMGRMLERTIKDHDFSAAVVVPVPLHRKRQRERGFNQAQLIAKALALPVDTSIVRRCKNTVTQTGLSRSERSKNLAGAFEVDRDVKGQTILVIDDVLTTGATMNEIARALKKAGAQRVEVVTFARVPDALNRL
jgi:ComF family protein